MAKWDGPFKLPRWTSEEFTAMKAKYVAKHGYRVTVPGFDDIIHLKTAKPMTEEEESLWKGRKYDQIPAKRRAEIRNEKQRKKDQFLAMLASPSPRIAMNVASIMTSLDDAQDAISTLAAVGMIAAKVLPKFLQRAIMGPLGWVLAASDLMNLLNPYSRGGRAWGTKNSGRAAKKKMEKMTEKNPFSKKARAKRARRIRRFRPSIGTAVEAAQTTDEIFGIGISLGPIMGFAQDVLFGMVRDKMGQTVTIDFPPRAISSWGQAAMKCLKSSICFQAFAWESDMTDEIASMIAVNLSLQAAYPLLEEWNPLEEVDNIGELYIKAPVPTDILTIEVIEEAGYNVEDLCGWPGINKLWASLDEISTIADDYAARNIRHFGEKNRHNIAAFIGAQNANDFAVNMIAALEGPDQVVVDYIRESRIMIIILDNGFIFPDAITPEQIGKFQDWCYTHEYLQTMPTVRDIWRYAQVFCDFTWVRSPIELR